MIKILIEKNDKDQRLDRFLKKYLRNAPLSYIYKAIRKDVKVNGKRAAEDYMLNESDEISLYISDDELERLTRKKENSRAKRQFGIIYEDDNILVCDKPFGLLTHGDENEKKNTLVNQVIAYLIGKGDYVPRVEKTFTPAACNRLDRNTTGLVIFGKNAGSLKELNRIFRERDCVKKLYRTIVGGNLKEELFLEDRIEKNHRENLVRVLPIDEDWGKVIKTAVRPVTGNGDFTLVEVDLVTGRTHQIRAHLSDAGYPLIGDPKYGDKRINRDVSRRTGLNTQLLHAYMIAFGEISGELEYLSGKEFVSPLPEQFDRIRKELTE